MAIFLHYQPLRGGKEGEQKFKNLVLPMAGLGIRICCLPLRHSKEDAADRRLGQWFSDGLWLAKSKEISGNSRPNAVENHFTSMGLSLGWRVASTCWRKVPSICPRNWPMKNVRQKARTALELGHYILCARPAIVTTVVVVLPKTFDAGDAETLR